MTTVARLGKQVIQAHRAVRIAKERTQEKLDALLATNPLYSLFDPDKRHPYFPLASSGAQTLDLYQAFVAGLLGWSVAGVTIGDELDKVKAHQIVNGSAPDADLDAVRLLQPLAMDTADAANRLLSVYDLASHTWSRSEAGMIKNDLSCLYGRSAIQRHLEADVLKISSDCRTAVRAIKNLGQELLDCAIGGNSIRVELEKIRTMSVLGSQPINVLIDLLLKRA